MTQIDNDAKFAEVKSLVDQLFRAENDPGERDVADRILAQDYIPITRASGKVDATRDDTLSKIGTPPKFERQVDRATTEVAVFHVDAVAIATSVLPTIDRRADPPTGADYRNIHVFVQRDGRWECVAWQVTKVQP